MRPLMVKNGNLAKTSTGNLARCACNCPTTNIYNVSIVISAFSCTVQYNPDISLEISADCTFSDLKQYTYVCRYNAACEWKRTSDDPYCSFDLVHDGSSILIDGTLSNSYVNGPFCGTLYEFYYYRSRLIQVEIYRVSAASPYFGLNWWAKFEDFDCSATNVYVLPTRIFRGKWRSSGDGGATWGYWQTSDVTLHSVTGTVSVSKV